MQINQSFSFIEIYYLNLVLQSNLIKLQFYKFYQKTGSFGYFSRFFLIKKNLP